MGDCDHGTEVFCYYALSAVLRDSFETHHRHAYNWATETYKMAPDWAERYAGYYAVWNYDDEASPHSLELERWLEHEGIDRYAVDNSAKRV